MRTRVMWIPIAIEVHVGFIKCQQRSETVFENIVVTTDDYKSVVLDIIDCAYIAV